MTIPQPARGFDSRQSKVNLNGQIILLVPSSQIAGPLISHWPRMSQRFDVISSDHRGLSFNCRVFLNWCPAQPIMEISSRLAVRRPRFPYQWELEILTVKA